jgi:hypothetical protein
VSLIGSVRAQESKVKTSLPLEPKPVPTEVQVFPLRFADARETAAMLGNFVPGVSWEPIQRSNSILVAGSREQLAKVKDFIAKVDVEGAEAAAAPPRMKILPLRHIEPDQYLEEAIKIALLGGSGGSFAVDRPRKSVFVTGGQGAIDAVASLLASLDTPAARTQDLQVRIVWLVSSGEAPAPPDDLKEVLPALAKLGIDKPRLAAQTVVNTTPNAQFQAQGVTKIGSSYQFSATGRLTDKPDAPELQVNIRAVESGNPGAVEICALQTQIAAPPGHLVVLGVTPTGSMTSVFVVQVTRPNANRPAPPK